MLKHRYWITLTTILCSLSLSSNNYADTVPNDDQPTTFLGPTIAGNFVSSIGSDSAYSIFGEAGGRNFRAGLTFGWNVGKNQRFKATGDYLWQRLDYGFFSGDEDYTAQQGSVSAAYQYDLADPRFQSKIGINGYFSYALDKSIGIITGQYLTPSQTLQPYSDLRRTTGARGRGISPAFSLVPWHGAVLTGEVNYDNVGYDQDYIKDRDAIGVGGTIRLDQAITQQVSFSGYAAVREPFNDYFASFQWSSLPCASQWVLGLFGEYTIGKLTLPTTYNVGISIDYFFDKRRVSTTLPGLKDPLPPQLTESDQLLEWTNKPSVRLPIVYSVRDDEVTLS